MVFILLSFSLLSHVWLFVTPWTAAYLASLAFTVSQSLHKFISIELVLPSTHLILCHTPFLLPSVFHSISIFSNESALCNRQPKYWSFSFSISSSSECSVFLLGLIGLISLLSKFILNVQYFILLKYHSPNVRYLVVSDFCYKKLQRYRWVCVLVLLIY